MPTVAVVVGEASGDLHAAGLVRALLRLRPNIHVWAVGGPALRQVGAEILFPAESLTSMGLLEAAGKVPALIRAQRVISERFDRAPPDLFVPVDFGGFNLRLARTAWAKGVPVVYYIPPKVWAWGKWRARKLSKFVDEALVILPFEVDRFRRLGVPSTYVGSPVLDHLAPRTFDPEPDVVGLLPGSRESEVSRIWPMLLEAARILARRRRLRFLAALAPGLKREALEGPLRGSGLAVEILGGDAQQVMERSRLVLVASGTATLECAALGTPMVVVYRVDLLTYALARILVRVPFISLPNLIAGRQLVPELIQKAPDLVARTAESLLDDGPERTAMGHGLAEVRRMMGARGASARAAGRIVSRLERTPCN